MIPPAGADPGPTESVRELRPRQPKKYRCEARTKGPSASGLWTRCAHGATQLAVVNGRVTGNFCRRHAKMWRGGRSLSLCVKPCGRYATDCQCMFGGLWKKKP